MNKNEVEPGPNMIIKGNSSEELEICLKYIDPNIYSEYTDLSNQGMFLNNRAVLLYNYRNLCKKNPENEMLNDLFEVYQNFSSHHSLPFQPEQQLNKNNLILMLLRSIQVLTEDRIMMHRLENLNEVEELIETMDLEELNEIYFESERVIPLINLADYLMQGRDKSLRAFGMAFFRIADKICSRLSFNNHLPRLNTLRAIALLDEGNLNDAEVLLSSSKQTGNFSDYFHEMNPIILSIAKTSLGDEMMTEKLKEKSKELKRVLKVPLVAVELNSLMMPTDTTELLQGK